MINLSKFPLRLKELMDEREINAPTLARETGTDRTNITRYLNGERTPRFKTLVNIAEYFNCSADYLLGLSDYSYDGAVFLPVPPFGERLKYVIKFCNFTQYRLQREKHFAGSVLYGWLSGKKLPSAENLAQLAKALDCSVDFLIGRES